MPAVSWPRVPAWGSLEPPRRDGENAQKTGKNGGKMGEISSKTCEQGRDRRDQLVVAIRASGSHHWLSPFPPAHAQVSGGFCGGGCCRDGGAVGDRGLREKATAVRLLNALVVTAPRSAHHPQPPLGAPPSPARQAERALLLLHSVPTPQREADSSSRRQRRRRPPRAHTPSSRKASHKKADRRKERATMLLSPAML